MHNGGNCAPSCIRLWCMTMNGVGHAGQPILITGRGRTQGGGHQNAARCQTSRNAAMRTVNGAMTLAANDTRKMLLIERQRRPKPACRDWLS